MRLTLPLSLHQRLQRRLAYVVLLAALALVGADALSLRHARQQAMTEAWLQGANLARSLSDQTSGILGLADGFVVGLRDQIEAMGTGPEALRQVASQLPIMQKTFAVLRDTAVLDAQGHVVAQYGAGLSPALAGAILRWPAVSSCIIATAPIPARFSAGQRRIAGTGAGRSPSPAGWRILPMGLPVLWWPACRSTYSRQCSPAMMSARAA
jgi:hypothetical protein